MSQGLRPYLQAHVQDLQSALSQAVMAVLSHKPANPATALAHCLAEGGDQVLRGVAEDPAFDWQRVRAELEQLLTSALSAAIVSQAERPVEFLSQFILRAAQSVDADSAPAQPANADTATAQPTNADSGSAQPGLDPMPDAFELDRLIRAAAESACPANPSRCIVDATREARLGEAAGGRETLPVRELAGGGDKRLFVLRGVTFEVDARYKATAALSGAGAYALSCKAKDEKSGQDVTITKHPDLLADTDDAVGMLRWLAIVRALAESWGAQNVMRVQDVMCPAAGAVSRDVYVCEEQMGATLDHIIRSKQPLSEEHVQYFFYQVTCALKAAHARGVAHRDLQPTHVHINQNCDVKVSGWEHARAIAAQDGDAVADVALTEYVTTRWYRAPEVLLESGAYGEAVDLWALGCVLAELLQRKALFPGRDYIHQIGLIIAMVGSPTDEELRSVVPLHSAAAKHCLKLRESNPTQRVDWAHKKSCRLHTLLRTPLRADWAQHKSCYTCLLRTPRQALVAPAGTTALQLRHHEPATPCL